MHLKLLAVLVGSLAGLVRGGGINCKGSWYCGSSGSPRLWYIVSQFQASPPSKNDWYTNGMHIGCFQNAGGSTDGVCVFLQGTGGVPGDKITDLLEKLQDHGCQQCGSIPIEYPGDNNEGDYGILTVNYVSDRNGCDGVCEP